MKLAKERKPTDFEQVLINRDGMTKKEAQQELYKARDRVATLLAENECGGYDAVEEFLLEDYGLEMDYIYDILP